MRWSLLNVPLGLTDPARFKCAGWEEALIGMAAGSFASFLDSQNVENTNAANERIAFRTNEANKEINQQQLAWAREKYQEEKAENRFLVDQAYQRELENRRYNSPAQQMLRYQQAGINPYLAMYGGGNSGGVSSIGSTVGSPPKYSNPSMIPMQQGAPAQAFTGFGEGISRVLDSYYRARDAERADYALASDITFRDRMSRQDARKVLVQEKEQILKEKEYGLHEKELNKNLDWIDRQIEHLNEVDLLERDKYEHQKEYDAASQRIDEYRAETERINANTNKILADSQIALNRQSEEEIKARVRLSDQEVKEMVANGRSKREIERFIAKQEETIYKQLLDDYRKTHSQAEYDKNAPVLMKKYRQVANYMLEPLRGVLGVSANAGVSAAKKMP